MGSIVSPCSKACSASSLNVRCARADPSRNQAAHTDTVGSQHVDDGDVSNNIDTKACGNRHCKTAHDKGHLAPAMQIEIWTSQYTFLNTLARYTCSPTHGEKDNRSRIHLTARCVFHISIALHISTSYEGPPRSANTQLAWKLCIYLLPFTPSLWTGNV